MDPLLFQGGLCPMFYNHMEMVIFVWPTEETAEAACGHMVLAWGL